MKTELKSAITKLYKTFGGYSIKGNLRVRCCNCCVTNEEIIGLTTKAIKNLNNNDLGHYMRSAITTFGDIEDYKYFLPRIFELIAYEESYFMTDFITFEKLNYAEWETWSIDEIRAIESFFDTLLKTYLNKPKYDFEKIKDSITLAIKYSSSKNVIYILENSKNINITLFIVDSVLNNSIFCKDVNEVLEKWFYSVKTIRKIEDDYFKIKDAGLANKVSIAYTILDNIRK